VSAPAAGSDALVLGGLPVSGAVEALRRLDPHAHAFHLYDLDALAARARRFRAAFASVDPLVVYAIKANGLPAILATLCREEIGADAGSLGELELAAAAGFDSARIELNGNGRTVEEAEWAVARGIHSVNADHLGELDLLEAAAARAGTTLRVALRVNPGIDTPGHQYVATGHDEAKFGISPREALEAWSARRRWAHLDVGGLHVHVGSQLLDPAPLERAAIEALALARTAAERGAPLTWINLGGGFGLDYEGHGEFPLERHAGRLTEAIVNGSVAGEVPKRDGRGARTPLAIVFEPGRWMVGPIGMLVAEVLWVKQRDGRRFVVLGAGMNDFIRPALYHARHRMVPVVPRAGAATAATVVGPVCESGDVFATDVALPPLAPGDWIAFHDTGAYGAAMASNYNGRGRLAELAVRGGRLIRARAAETPADLVRGCGDDVIA
jgi:diaminopimelate decarboxylase